MQSHLGQGFSWRRPLPSIGRIIHSGLLIKQPVFILYPWQCVCARKILFHLWIRFRASEYEAWHFIRQLNWLSVGCVMILVQCLRFNSYIAWSTWVALHSNWLDGPKYREEGASKCCGFLSRRGLRHLLGFELSYHSGRWQILTNPRRSHLFYSSVVASE